ncbi:hypothetical protein MXD81_21545, partial [Microbacteriaceae bacterium K1510]|nr:hypothetical protein [Microbacteriaceae bacterium K1510]
TTFTVETLGGIVTPVIHCGTDGKADQVTIDMGEPGFTRGSIPMTGNQAASAIEQPLQIEDKTFTLTAVSMGNPHAVLFVDELKDEEVT